MTLWYAVPCLCYLRKSNPLAQLNSFRTKTRMWSSRSFSRKLKLDVECKRLDTQLELRRLELDHVLQMAKLRACIGVPPYRPDNIQWNEVEAEPFEASLLAPSSKVTNQAPGEHEYYDQTGSRASCQACVMQTPGLLQMC